MGAVISLRQGRARNEQSSNATKANLADRCHETQQTKNLRNQSRDAWFDRPSLWLAGAGLANHRIRRTIDDLPKDEKNAEAKFLGVVSQ